MLRKALAGIGLISALVVSGCASEATQVNDPSEIPQVMENLGFNISDFDEASGRAGDLQINGIVIPQAPDSDPNKASLDASYKYLMSRYGETEGNGSRDVQMSFYLPLGTPVIAPVTGTVCDVPKLYSGDYSVRIAPTGIPCQAEGQAAVLFETEHVNNPQVKFGDSIQAGDKIAEVSNYAKAWEQKGLGIVELGVFFSKSGSNSPWHACPLAYLSQAAKPGVVKSLDSAYQAWERYLGEPNLYDESTQYAGCATMDAITDNNNAQTGNNDDPKTGK